MTTINQVSSTALQDQVDQLSVKVENLTIALNTARVIGMAVGIAMERLKVSEDLAFDILVRISQNNHRKLRDIASELVFSGVLPV